MRRLSTAWLALACLLLASRPAFAADVDFRAFLDTLRPEAEARGVSPATFDAVTRELTPDLGLPDLALPGRPATGAAQAEFTQTPAAYLSERSLQNLAGRGRRLLQQHRSPLDAIEARFGVPAPVLLAIWGRETAFGDAKLPHDVLRALATQAYAGRRKERFREELLAALKLVEEGRLPPARRRSSWAGAIGLVQFLPSDYQRYGSDGDGDGAADIWTSAPDALASAASQLAAKGWRRGRRWAHEVRVPKGLDCTQADPALKLPLREWLRRGFASATGAMPADLGEEVSLLLPAGTGGPAFLIGANYFVVKDTTSPISTSCSSAISPTASPAADPSRRRGRCCRSSRRATSRSCKSASRMSASIPERSTARPAWRRGSRSAASRRCAASRPIAGRAPLRCRACARRKGRHERAP